MAFHDWLGFFDCQGDLLRQGNTDGFVAIKLDFDGHAVLQKVAIFTDKVETYEQMKLTMLNGAHSMLAYTGFLSGHTYVRDVINDASLAILINRHMAAASQVVERISGFDVAQYASDLVERFANTAIAHETYQIAMDGSQKMPQRIFEPALKAAQMDTDIEPFAFATAMWIRYCSGRHEDGETYPLRDPLQTKIATALTNCETPTEIIRAFERNLKMLPHQLMSNTRFATKLKTSLEAIYEVGVEKAVKIEAWGADAANV